MLDAQKICAKVDAFRARSRVRDSHMEEILAVREGRWDDVFPGMLPSEFPRPMVANLIDAYAQDIAQVIAPLPSFNCSSANMSTDKARKFADKRTKVANYYADCSNLQVQMYPGADRLGTYGFLAIMVVPDFEEQMPKILVDNSLHAYYQNDLWNRKTLYYSRVFRRYVDELVAEYPEAAASLKAAYPYTTKNTTVEVARWWDRDQEVLVELGSQVILSRVENKLGKCPVRVVEMPKIGDTPRGQYDDVIWVQCARALAQIYALQAMDESVNAPIVTPNDVQDFPFGPKEIIRTENPQGVGRVALQIPNGVFAEIQNLTQELRSGARYPEGRSGQMDASIITGQGVEALMGTFSTQTQTAQLLLAIALTDVFELCFEMDEKFWPNAIKTVRGSDFGSPYQITYTPAKDINRDYSIDVTYGATAGLDPNRALVFLLQGQSAGIFSTDTVMRELPVDINVEEEKKKIAIELMRNASASAIAGLAQAIPAMAAQGQDPSVVVGQISEILRLVEKGESIEQAMSKVFAPPPPPEEAPAEDPMAALMAGGEPAPAGGGAPVPGADLGGGGGMANDLLMSMVGLTPGGNANLQSTISRRQPIPG